MVRSGKIRKGEGHKNAVEIDNASKTSINQHNPDEYAARNKIGNTEDGIKKNELSPLLVSLFAPNSFAAKQIDILRTRILFPEDQKPSRVIMVTSAARREGCSLLAANLAVTIARGMDQYVLVVDCNLLAPNMHKLFNVTSSPGLTNLLEKGASVPEVIHSTQINKLSVIPAGQASNLPAEILSTQTMANLVSELRDRYEDRYIILDTPAMLASDHAAILSRLTETVIFVIMTGSVMREQVVRSLSMLPQEKILGLVVNDTKRTVWDSASIDDIGIK